MFFCSESLVFASLFILDNIKALKTRDTVMRDVAVIGIFIGPYGMICGFYHPFALLQSIDNI